MKECKHISCRDAQLGNTVMIKYLGTNTYALIKTKMTAVQGPSLECTGDSEIGGVVRVGDPRVG